MKKIILFFPFFLFLVSVEAQNCIDALILNPIDQLKEVDTLYCKIMSEDEISYTIDNGFAITSLSKSSVDKVYPCVREMTAYEVYKYQGIDNVTRDYFQYTNTAGAYMRKAAFNTYLATGLGLIGGSGIVLGVTVFNESKSKNYWIVGGSLFSAASVFFIIAAWNQVYKAGKLLDINNKTALYLAPCQDGNMGLSIRF